MSDTASDNKDLVSPPASRDRVTDERSREGASPPSGSVPHGAGAFTPGPWRVVDIPMYPQEGIVGPSGEHVAEMGHDGEARHGRERHDARLIAAAPDLYEALGRALDNLETIDGRTKGDKLRLCDVRAVLTAALAKVQP
jgi:hypothetical protein